MSTEPELEEKTQETTALVLECSRLLEIKTPEDYHWAVERRSRCKAAMDFFDNLWLNRIAEANRLHKGLIADHKDHHGPPATQWARLGKLMGEFDQRKQREKERLEREAERKRKEEEAEAFRLAKLAEELGSEQVSEEILDQAAEKALDPGPLIKKEVPQVPNLFYRHGGYSWAIENRDLVPDDYWIVDEKAITVIVNRLGKKAESVIPGIVVVERPRIPIQK